MNSTADGCVLHLASEQTTAAQSLLLLEAAHCIAGAPDQRVVLSEVIRSAHELLGFPSVRVYLLQEGPSHARTAACLRDFSHDDDRTCVPLEASGLLGRIALGELPSGAYQMRNFTDAQESQDGVATCYITVSADGHLASHARAVVVAHCTCQGGPEVHPEAIELLTALAGLASVALKRQAQERERSRLVSAVSHELRTPLSAVRAFCEMLADGDAGKLNQKQQRFVDRIASSAEQLHGIVDDLLELSRLKMTPEALVLKKVQVKPFLEDTALNFFSQSSSKSIRISVHAPNRLPALLTDPQRLQQAFSNLVHNAVRYSPQGSRVRLGAEALTETGRRMVRIWVADEGPGIPLEEQERIFEEFYRCYRGQMPNDASKGNGLGLSIVAQLSELLGAEVLVESQVGSGSTFSLKLPLRLTTRGERRTDRVG